MAKRSEPLELLNTALNALCPTSVEQRKLGSIRMAAEQEQVEDDTKPVALAMMDYVSTGLRFGNW